MQENSENTKENFIKNLIKAAKEEIKSISTTTVALVLVCAMVSVLALNLCATNAKINLLESEKAGLADKLTDTENKLNNNIEKLENSLNASQQESANKDEIIQNQQNEIQNNEAAQDKLIEDLKEQIGNLDLTKSAASRSDSEINSIKNSIAEMELTIRDALGYSDKAQILIDALYVKVDEFQDVLDRYPDFYPAEGSIGSPFGYRIDPINGETRFHTGVDIGYVEGSPIFAAGKGVVTFVGFHSGYGLYVIVDHGDGLETKYAHLSESLVKVGDKVGKGEYIAKMGATGRVTGPHLHFEVVLNDNFQNPANYIL